MICKIVSLSITAFCLFACGAFSQNNLSDYASKNDTDNLENSRNRARVDSISVWQADEQNALVILGSKLFGPTDKAADFFLDEIERRCGERWSLTTRWPKDTTASLIWMGTRAELNEIPEIYRHELNAGLWKEGADGYRLKLVKKNGQPLLLIIGNDWRGVLYGIGHFLRKMVWSPGRILIRLDEDIATVPSAKLRGHQLGNRPDNNTYDAWDVDQWEQYIRDLVVFGANAIELIPPPKEGAYESVHNPMPPLEMLVQTAKLVHSYGLELWLWYPHTLGDYSKAEVAKQHLNRAEEIFKRLPKISALFVPGGDPGYTEPVMLMSFLEREATLLRRYHPKAGMWLSAQNFGKQWMEEFFAILRREPAWLTGVVYGPNTRVPLPIFRQKIPSRYPIRGYPDITHTFHCQYPVPRWDAAFALTEGREPINPRPVDQAIIFQHEHPHTTGFISYSEGCNDDVNKAIWSALGWNPDSPVEEILRDYGRYFIGPEFVDAFAQGLLALERNWRGPLASNDGPRNTLLQFQELECKAPPVILANWRLQQALYRAYYDAFIWRRLHYETELEEQALEQLRKIDTQGIEQATDRAKKILDKAIDEPVAQDWRTRVFALGDSLFASIGMQLSVPRHQASAVNRGANLDMIDFPLNNRLWIEAQLAEIHKLADEQEQRQRLDEILQWTNSGAGGFYDDLGNCANEPHLVLGLEYASDPYFLQSPMDDFELIKDPPFYQQHPYRYSWLSRVSALQGYPLQIEYTGLDPDAQYTVRVVYPADRDDFVPRIRLLTSDGIEIHPFLHRPIPARPLEFQVPHRATSSGKLKLMLIREPASHGNGRGEQIAEIWLLKKN